MLDARCDHRGSSLDADRQQNRAAEADAHFLIKQKSSRTARESPLTVTAARHGGASHVFDTGSFGVLSPQNNIRNTACCTARSGSARLRYLVAAAHVPASLPDAWIITERVLRLGSNLKSHFDLKKNSACPARL
ncbi:unnamed protein product [Lota lota]